MNKINILLFSGHIISEDEIKVTGNWVMALLNA